MPVLKPTPYVEFDVNNPEHVASIMEVLASGKRTNQFKFNHPAEFSGGFSYAMHIMAMRWGEQMRQQHPEVFNFDTDSSTTTGADLAAIADNIRQLPIAGSKPSAPQRNIRALPPGATTK